MSETSQTHVPMAVVRVLFRKHAFLAVSLRKSSPRWLANHHSHPLPRSPHSPKNPCLCAVTWEVLLSLSQLPNLRHSPPHCCLPSYLTPEAACVRPVHESALALWAQSQLGSVPLLCTTRHQVCALCMGVQSHRTVQLQTLPTTVPTTPASTC